jgi:HK97 family phage major capsid protein
MNQLVARRTFSTEYDGETIQITAGRTRIAPDHPLAGENPDAFEPVANRMLTRRDGSEYRGIDHDGQRKALYTGEQVADAVEQITDEQRAYLQRQYERGSFESGAEFPVPNQPTESTPTGAPRDEALRTIEQHSKNNVLRSDAADRLDRVVREEDPLGLGARYLRAVASEDYLSAFGRLLQYGPNAHLRMSAAEVAAIQEVTRVEELRTMNIGTGSAGSYALPFTLDPSITLTSSGALNPIRQVARTESIITDTWKGVSSDGVTATYAPELTEVGDNSPTLAQPTVSTEKGQAFVPFSIEIGQDWPSLQSELVRLLSDAKDVLDALTTAQRVQTASVATLAATDAYLLKASLPARFIPNAAFTFHPNTLDSFYRFVGGGGSEPALMPERDGNLLGKSTYEWSTLGTGTTTGTKLGIYGDFKSYLIADRIGGTVELIPHLLGSNRRPLGARGLFYYWRTGAGVINPNALRYLEVK